jgi:hypothetical protein
MSFLSEMFGIEDKKVINEESGKISIKEIKDITEDLFDKIYANDEINKMMTSVARKICHDLGLDPSAVTDYFGDDNTTNIEAVIMLFNINPDLIQDSEFEKIANNLNKLKTKQGE